MPFAISLQSFNVSLKRPIRNDHARARDLVIKEHDIVVLTEDVPEEGLTAGDVGTVVHIHNQGEGYEVEFVTLASQTIVVASLRDQQVRPVRRQDVAQVLRMNPEGCLQ